MKEWNIIQVLSNGHRLFNFFLCWDLNIKYYSFASFFVPNMLIYYTFYLNFVFGTFSSISRSLPSIIVFVFTRLVGFSLVCDVFSQANLCFVWISLYIYVKSCERKISCCGRFLKQISWYCRYLLRKKKCKWNTILLWIFLN